MKYPRLTQARITTLAIVLSAAGCGWFSREPTTEDGTGVTGDADLADDAEATFASSPTRRRNPHRNVVDPYFVLGQPSSDWDVGAWANLDGVDWQQAPTLRSLRGQVVVVHFWVDGSEASERTMKAIDRLAREFQGDAVTFVGIFLTRESIADSPWSVAQDLAKDWDISFPIAADETTSINWWRSQYDHLPSTPTFVIGPEGKIVHLHPGPELFPSDEVADRICDDDFRALKQVIQNTLRQQLAETSDS